MNFFFNIRDISVYRSELMGWSVLWIMMLHFTFNQIAPLGFVAQYGFAGVDIFMLVSGLGLYYSLSKRKTILLFYKKRLLRIFPTYYVLGFVSNLLFCHDTIFEYLFRYSTIGFWTGGIYWEWYIPSIIMLYLISPFLKNMFDRRMIMILFVLCISILIIAYLLIDKGHIIDRTHFFFLYRIPEFIFGMTCAHWIKNNVSSKYFIAFLVAGIPFFVVLFPYHHQIYNYKYFSLLFLLPFFTFVFILISKNIKWLNPIMRKIGDSSLEIYLVQGMFFHALITQTIIISPKWHDTFSIVLIVLCSLVGIIIHWLRDKCLPT
jgi:peptidoglycan/LPS O-acetylase OafA/YrhL